MKNLIHDLTKLAENFMTIEMYQSNTLQKNSDLLLILFNKSLKKMHLAKFEIARKKFEEFIANKEEIALEDYYFSKSNLYMHKFKFGAFYNTGDDINKDVNSASEYLLTGFLIMSVLIYNNIFFEEVMSNRKNSSNIIAEILSELDTSGKLEIYFEDLTKNGNVNSKMLKCYYELYKAISNINNPVHYFSFKKILAESSNVMNKTSLRDLYNCLINCISFSDSSSGINKTEEYLEAYDQMIKYGIFVIPGEYLEVNLFVSYVQISCNLGKHEKIKDLINNFIGKLPEDERDNMNIIAMAHLHFAKSEYRKSLEFIALMKQDVFVFKYSLKNLQMMCYYELNDYESFCFALDSYRHFVNKNKSVNDLWKSGVTNFFNIMNKLFLLKENFDQYEIDKLIQSINESNVNKKVWLNLKIEELMNLDKHNNNNNKQKTN